MQDTAAGCIGSPCRIAFFLECRREQKVLKTGGKHHVPAEPAYYISCYERFDVRWQGGTKISCALLECTYADQKVA